jgi:hypothetical protein
MFPPFDHMIDTPISTFQEFAYVETSHSNNRVFSAVANLYTCSSTLSKMPRKKNPPPVPVVAFTMATRTASYGNTQLDAQLDAQSNTQSNTQLNTPDPTLDPTLDPALIPDESQRQTVPVGRKASLAWTDLIEETLFNELLKQDHLKKHAGIGFKSEAWTVVRDAV